MTGIRVVPGDKSEHGYIRVKPSSRLAEAITSLIETKTIANARGSPVHAAVRERSSTSSVLSLANRVCRVSLSLFLSAGSRAPCAGKVDREIANSEGRSRARFTRMHPARRGRRRRRRRRGVPYARLRPRRSSPLDGGSDIPPKLPHTVLLYIYICLSHSLVLSLTLRSLRRSRRPRKGTWGFAVYLHEDTRARARERKHALSYVRAHALSRSRPSNPLIGFIRASSITFSQGYTLAYSRGPTARIYHGNFAPPPTRGGDSPRDTPRIKRARGLGGSCDARLFHSPMLPMKKRKNDAHGSVAVSSVKAG